jgi:hypothetical protein
MEHFHRLGAAHVRRVRPEETVQRQPAVHEPNDAAPVLQPATFAWRSVQAKLSPPCPARRKIPAAVDAKRDKETTLRQFAAYPVRPEDNHGWRKANSPGLLQRRSPSPAKGADDGNPDSV